MKDERLLEGNFLCAISNPGPGKIQWTVTDVKDVAMQIKMNLPITVATLIGSGEWKGGACVQLEDMISRPTASDLVVNYPWLKAFIKKCPDRVPSAFFAADCFLVLDQFYLGRLLVPQEEGSSKKTIAAEEGRKIKALVGYLRYLWRSSNMTEFLATLCKICRCCSAYNCNFFMPMNQ